MHELILWCGFLGAWLLVAGPIYQALLELRDEDVERDRIVAVAHQVSRPEPVSPWWWLIPPAAYLIHKARSDRYQREVMLRLPDDDFTAFVSFTNKAQGWLMVGAGGCLIAVKETWELTEHSEWPGWLFWVLVVVMLVLSVGHVAFRSARERALVAHRAGASAQR